MIQTIVVLVVVVLEAVKVLVLEVVDVEYSVVEVSGIFIIGFADVAGKALKKFFFYFEAKINFIMI